MKKIKNETINNIKGEPFTDESNKEITFFDVCIMHLSNIDLKGKKAFKALKVAMKLEENDAENAEVDFEDAEYDLMVDAVEKSKEKIFSPVGIFYGRCHQIFNQYRD